MGDELPYISDSNHEGVDSFWYDRPNPDYHRTGGGGSSNIDKDASKSAEPSLGHRIKAIGKTTLGGALFGGLLGLIAGALNKALGEEEMSFLEGMTASVVTFGGMCFMASFAYNYSNYLYHRLRNL